MNNTTENSINKQELVGRRRFDNGIEFEKIILNVARTIQDRLLNSLPSNYSKSQYTNLGELLRAISEEFGRLRSSISDVDLDRFHATTRSEYLYEILGDVLFLDDRAINTAISDDAYREYLITVRNAYYEGSRKDNIESSVSDILGMPVTLKELYLNLRTSSSFYTIKDTHTMFFDILMDNVSSSSSLGLLLESIKFFIDMIKPAHVIYDTRLIWSDSFTNRSGKCTPEYLTLDMSETVYNADRVYLVTYVITTLYKYDQDDASETWDSGIISSVDATNGIIYLQNKKILVATSSSKLYSRSGSTDTIITISDLSVGDEVKYYSTKDSASSSGVIDTDWRFQDIMSSIDEDDEIITLSTGKKIVYNSDTLFYTRDANGEYRIFIDDLSPESNIEREIIFRATKYTDQFQFYNTPDQVSNNSYKQYDKAVIDRPYFQGNVKKRLETRDNLPEGPSVVVIDGVATVLDINGQFYKRNQEKNYAEYYIYRYSLFLSGSFEKQFSIEEPQTPLTEEQAKERFENVYGYDLSSQTYNIEIDITSHLKESTENTIIETITGAVEFCDRKAECLLDTSYEDTRKYWEYPDIRLTSGFVIAPTTTTPANPSGQFNLPAYLRISSDPNVSVPAFLPMLDSNGGIATKEDIVVYVDGLLVSNAVNYLDPWTGDIELTFLPPANTTVRIDYYYADRYPDYTTYTEEVGSEQKSQRLYWPYPLTVTGIYNFGGGDQDYQVDLFPILDRAGNLAGSRDISLYEGELGVTGSLTGTIQDPNGDVLVTSDSFSGITAGDTIIIDAENYLDDTLVYDIEGFSGSNQIIINKELGADIDIRGSSYKTVRYTGAPYSVEDVRPLLGHIHLETAPQSGKYLKFGYYYTHRDRSYPLLPDDQGASGPYVSMGYAGDMFYGHDVGYSLIPDMGITNSHSPYFQYNQVAKKGYRYRAFNLSNSSVINSRDTALSDKDSLDRYDLMFSPEYLTDDSKDIVLNDSYLKRNLTPETQLYDGTPPFVKTFSDDAHYKQQEHPESENTYQDPTASSHDLSGGFTIVGADMSGLVDYHSVCEFEKNKIINLYSSLKMVESDIEGYDGDLSTIEEGMRTIPIKSTHIEIYYPNREKRLNDYLDYINKVPDELREGTVKTLKGSPIAKKVKGRWRSIQKGDLLKMSNVPVETFNNTTGEYETTYVDRTYTILDVIDYETVQFSTSFKEQSGEYDYELIRERVYNVDTVLVGGTVISTYDQTGAAVTGAVGALNRILKPNGTIGFDYDLPSIVYSYFTGSEFYFPDPDPDPYPRSPDNPNIIGLPTGDRSSLISHETGLGPTDLNSIPLNSEIIGSDGVSVSSGYSGAVSLSGYTGPSGAVDLSLTGPTGDVNSRVQGSDDKYVIPSGESGVYLSFSESEHRIQWRNWDQDLIIINFGSSTGPAAGVLEEEPMGLLDDNAEGIKRDYWNVDTETLSYVYYFGTLIETSERVATSVDTTSYPYALIVLSWDEAETVANSSNPKSDLPKLDPSVTTYDLHRRIIREILYDNSVKVTEIQELHPVS